MILLNECCSPHRYSRPILGESEKVKNIIPKQMKLFHKNNYIGRNCTLSIAGELPSEIHSIVNNSKLIQLKTIPENTEKTNNITFNKGYKKEFIPRLEGGRILKAWKLPPAKENLLILGAEIAATMLCEGKNSALVKKLREEQRIIESIEIDLQILEEGGLILLDVSCPVNNINIANKEINNILKKSTKNLFTNKDIERAKKLVKNNIYFSLELSTQVASTAGNQALWGRHQSILQAINDISYWSSDNLVQLNVPKLS